MFYNFKRRFLEKKFDKNLSKFVKNRAISQKEIISIGVLTIDEISSKTDLQKELDTQLNTRNTKLMSFRRFNKLSDVSFYHFSEKDINWRGEFIQQNLQSFLEQPFDLLIGYFNTNNIQLKTAVLQSKATFKAGFSDVNSDLYELEIAGNIEDAHQFVLELKKYLQILKKIKN
jgi:hypothetical protein